MMYGMTKKYFHKLLDGLPPVLVVDVREGVQHVPEVLEIIFNRFPVKNQAEMMYDMKKKKNPSTTSWTPPSPRCRRP